MIKITSKIKFNFSDVSATINRRNVEDFANSINTVNPKISNSANAIQNSLDKLQKDIEKTDEMIADINAIHENNPSPAP